VVLIAVQETGADGRITERQNGAIVPDGERDMTLRAPAIGLALAADSRTDYLAWIDPGTVSSVTLRLMPHDVYETSEFSLILLLSLFIGFLFAIAAFNVVLHLNLQLRAVQYYGVYACGIILTSAAFEGLLFRLFSWTWPYLFVDRLAELAATVAALGIVQFSRLALRLPKIWPAADKWTLWFIAAIGTAGIAAVANPVNLAWPLHILHVLISAFIGAIAFVRARAGDRPARPLTLSFITLFIGVGMSNVLYYFATPMETALGWEILKSSWLEEAAFYLGISGEAVFMSFTVLQLVKTTQNEAIQAAEDGLRDRTLELDDADRRFLSDLTAAVEAHMTEHDLDVKRLAEIMAMSERTLRRRVKDICATTPAEFIRSHRLEHARTLLRNESYNTVAEVALAVGMNHAGHFARLYKETYGISPREEARSATEYDNIQDTKA